MLAKPESRNINWGLGLPRDLLNARMDQDLSPCRAGIPNFCGSMDQQQQWFQRFQHGGIVLRVQPTVNPMHVQTKLHVLTHCFGDLVPNGPQPGNSLETPVIGNWVVV